MIAAHGFDRGLVDQLALVLRAIGAAGDFFPVDEHAGSFEDAFYCGGYFGADAFAGD